MNFYSKRIAASRVATQRSRPRPAAIGGPGGPGGAAPPGGNCIFSSAVLSIVLWEKYIMAYVIAEPCIGTKDTACVDACPVDCIHPKKDEPAYAEAELLYIDPVECIDCGACVPVCPVSAIFALDDLPEKWSEFTAKNSAYYGR
jgi:NAD-dependent dihydropyrimidine dehydrogenase PreA subunit